MPKITVGVLRGGPSSEYEVSLKTGANVLEHLPKDKYKAVDIFISKDGEWHRKGVPVMPYKTFQMLDAVFNAMHGEYGEDGEVQKILEIFKVPYTGSSVLASRIAMRKDIARDILIKNDILAPPAIIVRYGDNLTDVIKDAIQKIGPPWVVKPAGRGSSVGVIFANDTHELIDALRESFNYDKILMVEKRIKGREATCGILENFRNDPYYTLPVVEIIPHKAKKFFNYEAKYDGSTREICPGRFDVKTRIALQDVARRAHMALGLRHYSRSDFIVARSGIYFLEVNTLPGLTSESLLPKAAEAIGCSFPQLLDHLIGLALRPIR